jgi:dTDP-4-dehydrorhamnose 3,5-epimerase
MFDVIVDLRTDSPTKGQWCSLVLEADKQNMLYVPKGFAHGFQTLTEDVQVLYLHTEDHSPENEGGFAYNSPSLNIGWPLPVTYLSARDSTLPQLTPDYPGIDV